jgi:predicted metal-binding protein
MVRKVSAQVPEGQLQEDLRKYRELALALGATDAKIIASEQVPVDERVRAKCMYPVCGRYGSNVHCPPHAPELDFVRKLVSRYRYGIFTKLEVPAGELSGPEAISKKLNVPSSRKNFEIVSKLESAAFFDGYYLAVGFGNACCRVALCSEAQDCAALGGKTCRFPLKSRPSMESVGMDAFLMAANAGWDVYPLGRNECPPDVPHGVALGLVLIH